MIEIIIPKFLLSVLFLIFLWITYFAYVIFGRNAVLIGYSNSDGKIDYVSLGFPTIIVFLLTFAILGAPETGIQIYTVITP